jgi:membrane-associated protease RseP (regulator of RpoE activity)
MKVLTLLLALGVGLVCGDSPVRAAEPDDLYAIASSRNAGWLGVSIQDMTPKLARSMETKRDRGALVIEVTKESPAELAGVKENDIITEFDGKKIADADDLRSLVRKTKAGSKVALVVSRKDESKTLEATIKERPEALAIAPLPPSFPKAPFDFGGDVLGLRLSTLNEQLGEYFNAPDGKGVLVEYVEPGSKGADAGVKAGDVIVKIGSRSVAGVRDARRAFDRYDEGEKIDVHVIRKGSRQTLTVIADDPESPDRRRFFFHNRPQSFHFEVPDLEGLRNLELESVRPNLDQLRIELDGLRNNLKNDMKGRKEKIKVNVRSLLREV